MPGLPILRNEEIDEILARIEALFRFKHDQKSLMEAFLDGVLNLVSCNGYSSLLQCNRFFSERDEKGKKGKIISPPIHRGNPPFLLVKLWEKFLLRSKSNLEEMLYKKRTNENSGAARLADLMSEDEWKKANVRHVAHFAKIDDMAYLWVRCSHDDLWVVCLRRKIGEPKFSLRDVAVLSRFGEMFYLLRRTWYLEKLKILTKKEREIVRLIVKRKFGKEAADLLKISYATYNEHMKNIHKKLDAHNYLDVLQKLEND